MDPTKYDFPKDTLMPLTVMKSNIFTDWELGVIFAYTNAPNSQRGLISRLVKKASDAAQSEG